VEGDLGFLTSIRLHAHAKKIAMGFDLVRQRYFNDVLRNIESQAAREDLTGRRTLEGEADLALKGYQMFLLSFFMAGHKYVKDGDFQEFAGHLAIALCGMDLTEAQRYQVRFHESRNDLTALMYSVAVFLADHIISAEEPAGRLLTARSVPLFTFATQLEIAKEFADRQTIVVLQRQIEETLESLTRPAPARRS